MRKLKSIGVRFEELITLIENPGTELTVAEKDKLRLIWYAGFATCHDILILEVAGLSDAQAEVELSGVTNEINSYMESAIVKSALSGRKGRGAAN